MIKHKYNLVYIPINKNAEFIAQARPFSPFADQYLLGNQALPHVTLCQFEALEKELPAIWSRATSVIKTPRLTLRFDRISDIQLNNYFWVSLIPDHGPELWELHKTALIVLDVTHKVWFDPHLTLFNSLDNNFSAALEKFKTTYKPIEDDFVLALGTSGFAGQFKEVIYKVNHQEKS